MYNYNPYLIHMWPVYKSICKPHIIHIHWLIGPWVSQVFDPWDLQWPDARTVNVAVDYSGHGCRCCLFWPGVEDGGGSGEAERGWRGDLYGFYMDCIMNYSVLHAFERMIGLDSLGFSGGSHHARWSQESSVLPCPLGGTYLKDCKPDDFMTLGIFGIGYAKGILGGATTTPHHTSPMTNVWHAASMCRSLGIPQAEKKDRLIHRKTGWSTVSRDKSKSHKDTPIKPPANTHPSLNNQQRLPPEFSPRKVIISMNSTLMVVVL